MAFMANTKLLTMSIGADFPKFSEGGNGRVGRGKSDQGFAK